MAYINVEVCSLVQAIKYIYKYISKGSDYTSIAIDINQDKVAQYFQGQYIRLIEAVWRLFKFSTYKKFLLIKQLAIYLSRD